MDDLTGRAVMSDGPKRHHRRMTFATCIPIKDGDTVHLYDITDEIVSLEDGERYNVYRFTETVDDTGKYYDPLAPDTGAVVAGQVP